MQSERLQFDSSFEAIKKSDVVVICVNTPTRDQSPDLSFIERACRDVAHRLKDGCLVVLESTTYPGTTEDVVKPFLEESGFQAGRDFLLAYSPERIDPGNTEFEFSQIPRIVGGLTPEATGVATTFYDQMVEKVIPVSSCRAAELAKLLENTFRHVNIALVNEMAMICHEMGIDIWEIVSAAASKPFGFMPFHPGPGVGGHCIPVDPTFLAWQVRRDSGHQFRILEQAQDVNAQMPAYVASRVADALNDEGKAVKGANLLCLGISYKPDVGDMRESPSVKVLDILRRRGAKVSYNDPFFPAIPVNGGWIDRTELSTKVVASADCVLLLSPHESYDLEWIADQASLVFDARNAFGESRRPNVVTL